MIISYLEKFLSVESNIEFNRDIWKHNIAQFDQTKYIYSIYINVIYEQNQHWSYNQYKIQITYFYSFSIVISKTSSHIFNIIHIILLNDVTYFFFLISIIYK